jgi:hypothetical protein
MEDLTPPLLGAIREMGLRISSGHSMKESLRLYLESANSEFAQRLREWWVLREQGRLQQAPAFVSHYQRAFILLLERGLQGQPTLEHLQALEDEVTSAAQAELELHVATLPFKVLLPLLFFQFPAYLVVLLGPILRDLNAQMGGP